MAITSANYTQAVADCRAALAEGGRLNGAQIINIIQVIQDHDGAALNDDISLLNTDYTAQMAILAAFSGSDTAADIVAAIATAKALLDPEVAQLVTDAPTDVTVAPETMADGLPQEGSY